MTLQIRGTGLVLATEFTDNKSPNDLFPPEWGKFLFSLLHSYKCYKMTSFSVLLSLILTIFCYYLVTTGIGAYFGAQCQKNGMLVRVSGDQIMMSPPLVISSGEIDEVRYKMTPLPHYICFLLENYQIAKFSFSFLFR